VPVSQCCMLFARFGSGVWIKAWIWFGIQQWARTIHPLRSASSFRPNRPPENKHTEMLRSAQKRPPSRSVNGRTTRQIDPNETRPPFPPGTDSLSP
jgi:hypothetical protein